MITTQTELRAAFWLAHPEYERKGRMRQNDYPTDTRCAWVDFVDGMNRAGEISDALAERAAL